MKWLTLSAYAHVHLDRKKIPHTQTYAIAATIWAQRCRADRMYVWCECVGRNSFNTAVLVYGWFKRWNRCSMPEFIVGTTHLRECVSDEWSVLMVMYSCVFSTGQLTSGIPCFWFFSKTVEFVIWQECLIGLWFWIMSKRTAGKHETNPIQLLFCFRKLWK